MPYNGVGLFTSLGAPTFPAVPNTYILASYFNATMNDVFTGLTTAMTKDGQSAMTANLPMGGNKVTGSADGSAASDLATCGQVFDSGTFRTPNLVSPGMTGTPVAPTAAPLATGTQVATLDYVLATAFALTIPSHIPFSASKYNASLYGGIL